LTSAPVIKILLFAAGMSLIVCCRNFSRDRSYCNYNFS